MKHKTFVSLFFFVFFISFVSVLLSAHIQIFSVSRMMNSLHQLQQGSADPNIAAVTVIEHYINNLKKKTFLTNIQSLYQGCRIFVLYYLCKEGYCDCIYWYWAGRSCCPGGPQSPQSPQRTSSPQKVVLFFTRWLVGYIYQFLIAFVLLSYVDFFLVFLLDLINGNYGNQLRNKQWPLEA